MANEEIVPVTPVTPQEVAPTPSPVVETPIVVAPVVVSEASVAPVVAPVVDPTPVPTPVETPVTEPVKPPETVLGEAPPTEVKEPAKEGEIPPVAEEDKQGGQSDEPAPPPSYEAFKVPENVKLDDERVSTLTKLLGDLEINTKADHTAMQEFGQKLIDTHISEVTKAIEDIHKYNQVTWDKQKLDWKDEFLKDPELGGNRFQTTVDAARTFISTHGGTPEEQAEFRSLMESSGLGNHKVMIRILARAGQAMTEGRPLAAKTPVSAPKSKTQTMYGKS